MFSWVHTRETEGERGDWNHSSALSAGECTHNFDGKGYRESTTVAVSKQDIRARNLKYSFPCYD